MKVLIIGKGGREHALAWKIAQSPRVPTVYCAPGNAGTALDAVNVALDINDFDRLVSWARKEGIDLTIVGPEEPLARGIVDHFKKHGLRIFGPSKEAAQLEASKVFAKNLMRQADVPTAEFVIFDHPDAARNYIKTREYVVLGDGKHVSYPFEGYKVIVEDGVKYLLDGRHRVKVSPPEPMVVKADGLAAGKGVFVCCSTEEALQAIDHIMVREEFGRSAGRQVVIEKKLEGEEISVLALVSGNAIVPLPVAQDHKRVGDGDTGPNTGGMGAYCPAPLASPELLQLVDREVFVPIVHAMRQRQTPFLGVLYAGLMLTNQGVRVLEFNCRFGDPEAQAILIRLKTDLLELIEACLDNRLEAYLANGGLIWDPRPSVCVVMASGGYPGAFEKGEVISGLARAASIDDVKVFHSGTRLDGDRVLTDGGRVLSVTALGETLEQARDKAYAACSCINWRNAFYRKDIGHRAISR